MNILTIDIETCPNTVYSWGLFKQNISITQIIEPSRMICWAAKKHGEKEVIFGAEWERKDYLKRLWKLLDWADVVIGYNHDKFDMPRIDGEFLRNGFTPPSPYQTVDLLKTVRKLGFVSNKLDYASQQLEIGAKVEHAGFQLWIDVEHREPKALAMMEKYNRQDVVLTEKLYDELLPWIKTHPNRNLFSFDEENLTCYKCGSDHVIRKGYRYTNAGVYKRYLCKSCGAWQKGKHAEKTAELRQ